MMKAPTETTAEAKNPGKHYNLYTDCNWQAAEYSGMMQGDTHFYP